MTKVKTPEISQIVHFKPEKPETNQKNVKTIPNKVQKKPTPANMPQHDTVMTIARA
jgi:hypothetical protein